MQSLSSRRSFLSILTVLVILFLTVGGFLVFATNSVALGSSTSTTLKTTTNSSSSNAQASARLPVIIIPGVAGSYLRANGLDAWPFPENASILQRLALRSDGVTPLIPGSNVTINGVFRSAPVNYYGTLIQNLTNMGYIENRNLFVFAYDWRLDLSTQLPLLDALVNNALSNNNATKVILIAHSMGGLIAEAYVQSSNTRAQKVDSIITMGTPYWGAPLAYYTAVNGYTFGNWLVNPLQMKWLAQNMTALYELLPRQPFIVNSTSGQMLSLNASYSIAYKGVTGNPNAGRNGNFSSTNNNVWRMNQGLLNSAMNFWRPSGTQNAPSPMPVRLYAIIGYGFQTLSGYNMSESSGSSQPYIQLSNGAHVIMRPIFSDGDGTVPLASAQISTASRTYYIANVPATGYFGRGAVSSAHGDLPSNPTVLRIVDQIINGTAPPPIPYRTQTLARSGMNFTLHSNAILSVRDTYGNGHLGPNSYGGIDENLSSGSYLDLDGIEYASLQNTNDTYIVSVNGTSDGEFTLSVNFTLSNGVSYSFAYPEVSVQNGTLGVVEINATNIVTTGILPLLSVTEVNGTKIAVQAVGGPTNTSQQQPGVPSSFFYELIAAVAIIAISSALLGVLRRRRWKN
jgi:pimeloyl-ACP methyl ester carboxylesterase